MRATFLPLVGLVLAGALLTGCPSGPGAQSVVVYTSVDQIYSEPILNAFAERTGTQVRAVYDVEAAKTTGLVNRLIAEASNPVADVWWNGEFAQTLRLADEGRLASYRPPATDVIPARFVDPAGCWTGLAGRARVIIVNTDLVAPEDYPHSRADLVAERWEPGDVGIAYPIFGTAATEAAALYAVLGPEQALGWYRKLQQSGARVVDGNSVVRDLVAAGQLKAGLTDTDDARGAVERGAPVTIIVPDQDAGGTLVIPGTVGLVSDGPDPAAGRQLVDYLTSAEAEQMLLDSGFAQIPLHPGAVAPGWLGDQIQSMGVGFGDVVEHLPAALADLRELFVR